MNDLPRHMLARIIAKHGREICDAPKRVESLLRDLCGAHRREINIISGALEERVAADLRAAGNSVPREVLLARLAARLRDNLAYTPEAARWGVETWAFALGIMSEAEFQARALTKSVEAERDAKQLPVPHPKSSATDTANDNSQTPETKRGTTYAPSPQSSQTSKPGIQPPPVAITHAPAPRRMPTTIPAKVVVPGSPPPPVSSTLPTRDTSRRGLTLRGCLIGVVLFIIFTVAAILVAPALILLLQEEQAQPSINEPRLR